MKNVLLAWMLGAGALAASPVAVAGGFAFHPEATHHYSQVFELDIGDMNGDGRQDLVLATSAWLEDEGIMAFVIEVHFQEPDGTLRQPVRIRADETGMASIALADVDGDGIQDIALSDNYGFFVFLADGADGFARHDVSDKRNCSALDVVDADDDGSPDFVCFGQTALEVLYGDGSGGTRDVETLAAYDDEWLDDMKVGDVTNDGRPDLLVLSARSSDFMVYAGNGQGFDAPVGYPKPFIPDQGMGGDAIAIGDFDGDGLNDVAIAAAANHPRSFVWTYAQREASGFDDPVAMETLDLASGLQVADLDGNGLSDIVVAHRGFNSVSRYLQWDGGLGAEHLTATPSVDASTQLALGDLNADGCMDAAVGSYSVAILHGVCGGLESDFNADGLSDVLWRNAMTGASALWNGADHADALPIKGVSNLAWQVAGVGDVDGDGLADVVWREATTGQNAIWLGGQHADQQSIARVRDLQWTIAGIGDFDGDGVDDLLWRHATDGTNLVWHAADSSRQHPLRTVANTDWVIAGVADFNGDGQDDLLWRNPLTGANTIWRSGHAGNQDNITDIRNTTWAIAGVGDFDADGRGDILWRSSDNGRNVIWRGGQYADQAPVRRVGDTEWRVAAVGDYDGDGRDDILWRHAASGRNVIWNGAQSTEQHRVRGVTNTEWQVIP